MQLLEKFGISQFLNNGVNHAGTNVNLDALQSAPNPEQMGVPFENFVPQGPFSQGAPNGFNATSFSPFSPDPAFPPEGIKRDNISPSQTQVFPSSAKGFAPWYNSAQQDEKISPGASGKVSPPSSQTSRPASRGFGSFLGDAQAATPYNMRRASSRQEAPIGRPEMSRRPSQTLHSQEQQFIGVQDREHDHIQDLNGTLASLNLDNSQGSWKVGNEIANTTSP